VVTGSQTPERFDRYGLQITFEIPIYDFGEARTRDAEETYMQAARLLAEKGGKRQVGSSRSFYRLHGAFEVARLYQAQVEPLQNEILKQSLCKPAPGKRTCSCSFRTRAPAYWPMSRP